MQGAISSGSGRRVPGGREFRELHTKTSRSGERPIAAIIRSSSCPALPTNGRPWASSSAPGASPTKQTAASGLPRANTVCVRVAERPHLVQTDTSAASSGRRTYRSVAGTTTVAVVVAVAVAGKVAVAVAVAVTAVVGAGTAVVAGMAAASGARSVVAVTGTPGSPRRGKPIVPASCCHSRYARSDAASFPSSARASSVIATAFLRRLPGEVNPRREGAQAWARVPVVVERRRVVLRERVPARLAPEAVPGIGQDPERRGGSIGLHVDLQHDVRLVDLRRVGLGRKRRVPLGSADGALSRPIGAARGRRLRGAGSPGKARGTRHDVAHGAIARPVRGRRTARVRVGVALHDGVAGQIDRLVRIRLLR